MKLETVCGIITRLSPFQTAVCYEPERAKKSTPKEFIHVKESPLAGLGAFASKTLPIGTVFGPCKGYRPTNRNIQLPEHENKGRQYTWLVCFQILNILKVSRA
jgi:hypothetical protein